MTFHLRGEEIFRSWVQIPPGPPSWVNMSEVSNMTITELVEVLDDVKDPKILKYKEAMQKLHARQAIVQLALRDKECKEEEALAAKHKMDKCELKKYQDIWRQSSHKKSEAFYRLQRLTKINLVKSLEPSNIVLLTKSKPSGRYGPGIIYDIHFDDLQQLHNKYNANYNYRRDGTPIRDANEIIEATVSKVESNDINTKVYLAAGKKKYIVVYTEGREDVHVRKLS